MAGILDRISDRTHRVVAKHRSKKFLEGAMAAAALVALADGDASLEEGAEVGRLMRVFDLLTYHDQDDGVSIYLKYVDELRRSDEGAERAKRAVMAAAEESDKAAQLIIVLCQTISEADGIVRESERDEIRNLAKLLSIDPIRAADDLVSTHDM